jgi:DNA-binding FrmR family transcriptional regulator
MTDKEEKHLAHTKKNTSLATDAQDAQIARSHTEETHGDASHPSHYNEIPRLNRAIGQMEGVRKMIENRRYCPEILLQLKAVRSAVKSIESNILKTHLESCVAGSFEDKNERDKKIAEIKELLDRFQS